MTLTVLPVTLAICRLEARAASPAWVLGPGFSSVTRTADELSVICDEARVPDGVRHDRGWRALKLEGPFPLDAVGVLAPLAEILARSGVSIVPIATFDTDYVLVKAEQLALARERLTAAGHRIEGH